MTSFDEFKALVAKGNVIPVFESLLADTETPVSVYAKLRTESTYSFLLESVEGGEKLARYSFLGYDPFMLFTIEGDAFTLVPRHDDVRVLPGLVRPDDPPLVALDKIFAHLKTVPVPGLPRLTGGAVGYFGYETARLVEHVPLAPTDDLPMADAVLMFCDTVVIFDNLRHRMMLVSNAYIPDPATPENELRQEYDKAVGEIGRLNKIIRRNVSAPVGVVKEAGEVRRLMPKERFTGMVKSAREYIQAGDIFQVVLSQRVVRTTDADPFDVYRMLRLVNPSPYMFFLHLDNVDILGASPEMLVRVEGGTVETRPIAGTRRRGATAEEDAKLEAELVADSKERAEHLMLVDLGRNDLGRICTFGTVEVRQHMAVEKYSHVMHLVSSVRGKVREGVTPLEALYACFPAGTLSGAPKIRAMEIIAELEPHRRGVYGGAVGYIDFSGNLDSCIAIRTIVAKDGTLVFQAGAGIVYDSLPEREYEETLEKLGASLKACELLLSPGP